MALPDGSVKVQRLASEGLLNLESLTEDDQALIDRLSPDEITTLIQVAKRIYPDDPTMLKVQRLNPGSPRIFVPL